MTAAARRAVLLGLGFCAVLAAVVLLVVVVLLAHLDGTRPALDGRSWALLAMAGACAALPFAIAGVVTRKSEWYAVAGGLAAVFVGAGALLAVI